jgi:hypothetical protein
MHISPPPDKMPATAVSVSIQKRHQIPAAGRWLRAALSRWDEALIESYARERRKWIASATVSRRLATLCGLLRLAYEWQLVKGVQLTLRVRRPVCGFCAGRGAERNQSEPTGLGELLRGFLSLVGCLRIHAI